MLKCQNLSQKINLGIWSLFIDVVPMLRIFESYKQVTDDFFFDFITGAHLQIEVQKYQYKSETHFFWSDEKLVWMTKMKKKSSSSILMSE